MQEWANAMARRPSSVRPSVRLSVCLSVNFCANRFFSQTYGRIATKLAHDGLQVSMHPGCAQGQGQGQRSRDTRTFLDSWNELLRHWRSGCLVISFRFRTVDYWERSVYTLVAWRIDVSWYEAMWYGVSWRASSLRSVAISLAVYNITGINCDVGDVTVWGQHVSYPIHNFHECWPWKIPGGH